MKNKILSYIYDNGHLLNVVQFSINAVINMYYNMKEQMKQVLPCLGLVD